MPLTLRARPEGERLLPVGCGQLSWGLTTRQEATLSVEDVDFVVDLSEDEEDDVVAADLSDDDFSVDDFSEDDDAATVDDLPSERLSVR